jgi:hypothetical protein
VIPYVVGAIAVSRSDTDQRLGDRWAKTVVVLVGTESKATQGSVPVPASPDPFGMPSPPAGAAPPATDPLPPPPP